MTIKSKIGAHVSIAGGIWNAPQRGSVHGCEVIQIFTRSPQGGPAPKIDQEVADKFKAEMAQNKISQVYIHTPYYINFASEKEQARETSSRIIREELERGSMLGSKYIMTHLGSAGTQDRNLAIEEVGRGLAKSLSSYEGSAKLLLEISAGAGAVIGCTFEEIKTIIDIGDLKSYSGFGGICFDTCHAFASGYDFRTKDSTAKTLGEFDKFIGLDLLKLTHVNDSKGAIGDRKDRHEHIGEGMVGIDGMSHILSSEPFQKIDWILETPEEKRLGDIEKLKRIRVDT